MRRPITILNTIDKIYANVLVHRIKKLHAWSYPELTKQVLCQIDLSIIDNVLTFWEAQAVARSTKLQSEHRLLNVGLRKSIRKGWLDLPRKRYGILGDPCTMDWCCKTTLQKRIKATSCWLEEKVQVMLCHHVAQHLSCWMWGRTSLRSNQSGHQRILMGGKNQR